LASCACQGCAKACGGKQRGNKAFYLGLLFVMIIIALTLRYWGGDIVVPMYVYDLTLCKAARCVGYLAVYRISFALFAFYMIHCLLLLCRGCGESLNEANFIIQSVLFAGVLLASWFIPQDFFDIFVHVARVASGLFLLLQICLFIDFAMRWNEDWTSEEKQWHKGVLAMSLLLYAACIASFVLGLNYFGLSGCNTQKFFVVFTLMFTFAFSVFSITEFNKSGASFLSSAVVSIYMYYLLFSAMMSNPDLACNPYHSSGEAAQLTIGLIISAASITYAGYSLANSGSLWGPTEDEAEHTESLSPTGDVETGDKDKDAAAKAEAADHAKDKKEDDKAASDQEKRIASVAEDKRNSKFHFFMAITAMYMAMLLTSWGSHAGSLDGKDPTSDLNEESLWIKIVTQWVTGLLYTWVIVAPSVMTNREF
jgi:hypothetical protein